MGRLNFLMIYLLAGILIFFAACEQKPDFQVKKASTQTLSVLAGSEIKDLKPYFKQIEKKTGVALKVSYTGTLNGAERLVGGEPFDAAWFSHAKYFNLLDEESSKRITAQTKIMLSPVILGVKESYAERWGWNNSPVTWKQIAEKAIDGQLLFAMTNPAASNTGFTALIGLNSAFGEDLNSSRELLKGFFSGQMATAGSSSWLVDAYIKDELALNGIINYESVLISLNRNNRLREQLTLIYPSDGVVTADYPLILLDPAKRKMYDKVVQYLTTPDFQNLMTEITFRRPIIPGVTKSAAFSKTMLMELPFPGTLKAIDEILYAYLDEIRRPSTPIFVLDVSGSMKGARLTNLKRAINNLTGIDTSLTGQFARFRKRESIMFIAFNHQVADPLSFEITDTRADSASMGQIRRYINSLKAGGGTAIYDALLAAYKIVEAKQKEDPNRLYSIVLLSDGRSESGSTFSEFQVNFQSIGEDARLAKTFPIIFGKADSQQMLKLAQITGGRIFDGTRSLAKTFKVIRGYQ